MSPDRKDNQSRGCWSYKRSQAQVPRNRVTSYGKTYILYHGDHILVLRKLVAEESGKSDVLDGMLSLGLCSIVSASGCGSNSAMVLLAAVSGSCVVVCAPSVSILDDESPRRGLSKAVCGGVRRFTTAPSEGNRENENRVDAGIPSTSPGRCRGVEPVT